jgi:hypothetical protein
MKASKLRGTCRIKKVDWMAYDERKRLIAVKDLLSLE